MDEEPKPIYQGLISYLKENWKKIIAWVILILGFWLIRRGLFAGGIFILISLIWGLPLIIVGGIILKKELTKMALYLKPYLSRTSSLGPGLLNMGVIFIILAIIF